jgi:hypothetical protein
MEFNKKFKRSPDGSLLITDEDEKRFADTITGICTLVFMLKAIQSSE